MDSKAANLLGMTATAQDPKKRGLQTSVLKTTLYVQKKGYLSKKPFTANKKVVKHQKWQKRWFVLKDSFLIWYKSKPSNGDYDMHPAGVLPLGGCGVFPQGKSAEGYEFEVTHPDFNEASLLLRSPDEEDANDWIRWLSQCKDATWENAMLGDAQMMTLRTKDTKLEREAQAAFDRAKQSAEEIQKRRLERQKLMEEQEKQKMLQIERLKETQRKTEMLNKMEQQNLAAMEEKRKLVEQERANQKKLQEQLLAAREALLKLESLLQGRVGPTRDALVADINQLKDFLEANIPEDIDDTASMTNARNDVLSVQSTEHDLEDDESVV